MVVSSINELTILISSLQIINNKYNDFASNFNNLD